MFLPLQPFAALIGWCEPLGPADVADVDLFVRRSDEFVRTGGVERIVLGGVPMYRRRRTLRGAWHVAAPPFGGIARTSGPSAVERTATPSRPYRGSTAVRFGCGSFRRSAPAHAERRHAAVRARMISRSPSELTTGMSSCNPMLDGVLCAKQHDPRTATLNQDANASGG
jgi:hypothetical protein